MEISTELANKIVSNLKTVDVSINFIRDLQELRDLNYMTTDTSFTKHITRLSDKYDGLFDLCLKHFNISFDNRTMVVELCKSLIDYITKKEPVEITIAFNPDITFIAKLSSCLIDRIGITALIKINVVPAICGGVQVSYYGKFVDLSLDTKLTEYFVSHKEYVLSKL